MELALYIIAGVGFALTFWNIAGSFNAWVIKRNSKMVPAHVVRANRQAAFRVDNGPISADDWFMWDNGLVMKRSAFLHPEHTDKYGAAFLVVRVGTSDWDLINENLRSVP